MESGEYTRQASGIGRMFDEIDGRYDFLNHLFSLGIDILWRKEMIRSLMPLNGKRVLDLATGTGDSASDLVRSGHTVFGLDLSENMLWRAEQKITSSGFHTIAGSAYDIPFRNDSFDGMTCAFGIRNMKQTGRALAEIFRVVRPGGKIVFLEFSMPDEPLKKPYRLYLHHILPRIAGLFSKRHAYAYLGESIEAFHHPADFLRLIGHAGFSSCEMLPLSMGLVHLHRAVKPF